MKHITFFIISLLLCFSFAACDNSNQNIDSPVTYYYKAGTVDYSNPNGVLASEIRDASGHETDYEYLFSQYLKGPVSAEYISPFPAGTKLEEMELLTGKVNVVLSKEFAQLKGHELTIACTCLSRTLIEMTGLESVTISAKDTTLDGEASIMISKNDFLLTDDNEYIPDNSQ